jgi:hypothetical protein
LVRCGSDGDEGNAGSAGQSGVGGKAGGDSTGGNAGSGAAAGSAGSGAGPIEIENSGCPQALQPLAARGKVSRVGDGTPASCTEASLKNAIDSSISKEQWTTIEFDCGKETHTIVVERALRYQGKLMIDGGGRIVLQGAGKDRLLDMDHHSELVVQRLTLRDGVTDASGGAIHHPWYGTLVAVDVRFENNRASLDAGEIGGGAIFAGGLREVIISGCSFLGNRASNGGALLNRGSTLTVVDSLFENNEATSYNSSGQFGNGGGLYIDGMAYEDVGPAGDFHLCGSVFHANRAKQHGSAVFGYFYAGTTAYIDRCQMSNNSFEASPGGSGGLYHGGGIPLHLTNSTFSGNTARQGHGAAIQVESSQGTVLHLTSSTFVDNEAKGNAGAIFAGSPVHVLNCTFARNKADYAPAIFRGGNATVSLKNTIFFDNRTDNAYSALACHESFTDEGGNLQWPAIKKSGKEDLPCAAGILFADPLLSDLADYGGPTLTMALEAGSPAIDLGSDCPEKDQRGAARIGPCDSGAVEFQP